MRAGKTLSLGSLDPIESDRGSPFFISRLFASWTSGSSLEPLSTSLENALGLKLVQTIDSVDKK